MRAPAGLTLDDLMDPDTGTNQLQRLKLNAEQYEMYEVYAAGAHDEIADLGLPPISIERMASIQEKVMDEVEQRLPRKRMSLKETLVPLSAEVWSIPIWCL